MPVRVMVPTPLQRLTQGKEMVEGAAGTVLELVADLDRKGHRKYVRGSTRR